MESLKSLETMKEMEDMETNTVEHGDHDMEDMKPCQGWKTRRQRNHPVLGTCGAKVKNNVAVAVARRKNEANSRHF